MRLLSRDFMDALTSGFLKEVTQEVIQDSDLNLEIRDGYINVYYKGHSLLKLTEMGPRQYRAEIHGKFTEGLTLPSELVDSNTTTGFVRYIPQLKHNIATRAERSIEIEYEQMIIRANNYEPRNNSEYYILDRQYAVKTGRFDLVGFFWDRNHRKRDQQVPLCLMEIKFGLNRDISEVHNQLQRYYEAVEPCAEQVAKEFQALFHQKLDLGLYDQAGERIDALRTLTFSRDISQFLFVLVLVDYNPYSSKLHLENLAELPFARQVRVLQTGFAMWQQNVKPLVTEGG